MDEQTFQTRYTELMEKIKTLPDDERKRLQELAEETLDRRNRIQTALSELQESLDYLRLSIKYLVFDLEATRRENVYLRKLIEQSNREPDSNSNRPRRKRKEDDNFLDDTTAGAD